MVTVRLKPVEEIVKSLKPYRKVFVIGCQLGSGRCKNGGLREAFKVAGYLELHGFKISGVKSPGGTCILERLDSSDRSLIKEAESSSDAILSLACGAGTQLIAENVSIPVVTGVNTLFIGVERERKYFDEYCIACGECVISETGGICPVARCPKSLVNGPCGGAIAGKCEVDPSIPCIWYRIENRLRELCSLETLKKRVPLKDYRASVYPRRLVLED
ncbi:methylene-tetrahydrofolate reductase-like protein [Thermovibrio guaymasensis]|uniref:Methylene-tetrahydrofolate reductase-like protein n=1 Tax=Thermovibrio guaymasensis TaxID=240167 RepID=A0A420W972_9BACT|nr:methylenetetrahydrofolate reductase C-terminal domain-containing protein [Thermovibrio guaymasensis]RKQ63844.1 methylene-tetrahydrofolate reductase-like protein [Thermovibrio guaymasensis]